MLKIGWASRDLTPTRPVLLMGQMHARVATSALDPITVTALVVEEVVLVSGDVVAISEGLRQATFAALERLQPEVPTGQIILAATHTHDSLVFDEGFYTHPGGEVMSAAECTAFAGQIVAQCIAAAWQARTPAPLAHAFGHAVVGHNRYAVYADHTGAMYGKTNRPDFRHFGGYEDHGVDMLFTWDGGGRLSGVLLAIPCPSQVDEHLSQLSADYWHEVRVELRRRFGPQLQVLGWCAPAGDQSPHFLLYGPQEAEMRRRRGVSERQEIALRVADAVERALVCTPPDTGTPVCRHLARQLRLTPFQVSERDVPWAQAQYDEWVATNKEASSWWPTRLQQVLAAAQGKCPPEPVPARVHVLRLGPLAIATNPFELFLDYSLRLKARSPAGQTLLVQLADGCGWYLPSERAVQAGSYGAAPVVCPVGPEGGQELVEATLQMLGEVFSD